MTGFSLPFQLPAIKSPELEIEKYTNFLISLRERKIRSTRNRARPWDITLNVTTHCQLSCPYCETGNGSLRRSPGLLTPERFDYFMNPLYNTAFILRMFGTGESLLNKQFPKMVEYTKGKEVFSLLSTNLSIKFSDKQIDELLLCGLGIIAVSIDGASQETYSKYRRGGDYELVIENMQRLIARKKELQLEYPVIEWRFLVFEHNKHEIDRARHLAWMYGCDQIAVHPGSAPAKGASVVRATDVTIGPPMVGPAFSKAVAEKKSILQDAIRTLPAAQREIPAGVPRRLRYAKCDWLYFGTTVFPRGGVSPCCVSNHEDNDFGTMDPDTNTHFFKVWNDAPYQEARDFFHIKKKNKDSKVICASCPNMGSMDSQFVVPLRAVLRNAPGWVLKILACEPRQFFTHVDFHTLRPEMMAIDACREKVNQEDWSDIENYISRFIPPDAGKANYLQYIVSVLKMDACSPRNIRKLRKGIELCDEIARRVIVTDEIPDTDFNLSVA